MHTNLFNVFIIGVVTGDIGPKLGANVIDNGFLIMNHVRIPRDQMLMASARVLYCHGNHT